MSHAKRRSGLEGRIEKRIPARIEVHIRKSDGSNLGEILSTENISTRGARLLAGSFWRPGEEVLLRVLKRTLAAEGKIAYCRRQENGKFALGVTITSVVSDWGQASG